MKRCCFCGVFLLVGLLSFTGMVFAGVPRNGLVAEYLFEGNANDSSGNGNHGTVNGATLTENRYDDTNSAYEFDGIDDYLSIEDSESLNFTSSFT